MNRKLAWLHLKLQTHDAAQAHIDAHLMVAAMLWYHQGDPITLKRIDSKRFPVERLVLCPADAPQLGRLPDLGHLVRACLTQSTADCATKRPSYVEVLLHTCMPCPKAAAAVWSVSKEDPPDTASCVVLLNLVLATLLGLYPTNMKRPPFRARVAIYARVHYLLTMPPERQHRFVRRHQGLLAMCLSEYVCHIIPLYMPAERQALRDAFAVEPFFTTGPALLDGFRQDVIDSGSEPWEQWNQHAGLVNEKLTRLYKSKCRHAPSHAKRVVGSVNAIERSIQCALEAHVVVRYPCHQASDAVLKAEYAILTDVGGRETAAVADIHRLVTVKPLPANYMRAQERAILAIQQKCQHRAQMRRTKYLCLYCERRGRKSIMKLCTRTGKVVCTGKNNDHSGDSVVAIDTMGRVVQVRGVQYIFAPCCGTVQEYTGSGMDFQAPRYDLSMGLDEPCAHRVVPRPDARRKRLPCAMCDAPALPFPHVHVDVARMANATTYLCQKHTPPLDWLGRVANMRQLGITLREWDTKNKAAHRRG